MISDLIDLHELVEKVFTIQDPDNWSMMDFFDHPGKRNIWDEFVIDGEVIQETYDNIEEFDEMSVDDINKQGEEMADFEEETLKHQGYYIIREGTMEKDREIYMWWFKKELLPIVKSLNLL